MGLQITVNWPANLLPLGSFAPTNPGSVRGLTPITPNANNQSVIDVSDGWPLETLLAAGFTVAVGVGATSARPTYGLTPGMQFFDSTLGYMITRNAANTAWVNGAGSTV